MSIAGTIILFLSVLLHELSHSIVAKSYGIRVRQIMLFIFGGVSDIEEPKEFKKELKMAIAGPAVSLVLSAIFAVFWWLTAIPITSTSIDDFYDAALIMINGIFFYSSFLNLILGIFNLVPAFSVDGGRIL
ncbi:site-2 protease family protein [Candidatus Nitrosocosmicus hydrocola]|uniref:site-2 protease family protein n=1 Tax=Candidatus Nitrosocosmicus hydrocola TaxID=1826872 RepID=UPI0011E60836|nr:site-2 protease family protein [Candidatus Nitrosocosmicus hydrocola]